MIPEKRFLNQIQQVLARLMQPLWLLDTEGTVLLPEDNRGKVNLPEFMEPGMPVAFEGKTFLMIGLTPELILCADAQGAATHDCIVLAGAMVQSMGRGEAPIQSRYDVYRRVLREELTGSELEALAHEHQIEMNRDRCVLTFQILQTETETAFNMLEELVPRANGDLLVEMDRHTVVFLKSMENVESFDELYQLAEAIEHTTFSVPTCPVYQNVDALPHTDPAEIKANLIAQLTAPVRWTQTVKNMIADGATDFTECGPGKALQGMIAKISREVAISGIQ